MGRTKTHGMDGTRFYVIWSHMKNRCTNPNYPYFKDYMGRGITLYYKWIDFINFKVDMYDKYLDHVEKYGEENTSIDRIDNDLGYSPDNCKWSTRKEQNNNKRKPKPYTHYNQKEFIAISPDGEEFVFNNQRVFAEKYNLERKNINSCLNGHKKTHKGWKFHF